MSLYEVREKPESRLGRRERTAQIGGETGLRQNVNGMVTQNDAHSARFCSILLGITVFVFFPHGLR